MRFANSRLCRDQRFFLFREIQLYPGSVLEQEGFGIVWEVILFRVMNWAVTFFVSLMLFFQGGFAWAAEAADTCDPARYAQKRERMVKGQIQDRGVRNPRVLDTMRKVGRHCFVAPAFFDEAYDDHPLPIGSGQTISQPYIVALMTELVELKPTDRVLEIGTGSGYQTAVLAKLVREVFTVEIYSSLARKATSRLTALGYKNINVKCGDGYYGWEEEGPFDAIMVTAAASEIPPPLIKQLKPEGRMCIPVGGVYQVQQLTLITKNQKGSVSTRGVLPVRFVPLLGSH